MEDTEDPNIEGLLQKDQMSQNSDKLNVCDLCNKTFKSGKAIGGHMRIHYQKGKTKILIFKIKLKVHQSVMFKKQNPRAEEDRRVTNSVKMEREKKKSPTGDNRAGAVDIDERPSCPVCRKKFRSLKSVFGHMKKHSDRNWRGSRPPSIEKTSSDSCLSYDENPENSDQDELLADSGNDRGVDLTVYLRGWNSTARRGRKRLSLEMNDLQSKELEAAAGLMMLTEGDLESGLVHSKKGNEFEDVKVYDVSLNDYMIKNMGSKTLIKNKKKRKKVKLFDLQPPQNATPVIPEKPVASPFPEKYRCGTCEKSFQTGQAFGGHMSGHNKCTVVIKNVILKSENTSNPTPQETKENDSKQSMIWSKSKTSQEIDLNKLPASECSNL
ncbi:uncharacterized protein [Primulina huaijiensis]|uniref:uncharacterized protein n=1 Tax=Primulina huaijiensis TaxID=1492673 RepID=UPI003CC73173